MKKQTQTSGFALLMTLVVVGVVLSVGMSILDLSIKQVRLSTNSKESEIAFHAANAGMECARYWRRELEGEMEAGDNLDLDCFGQPSITVPKESIWPGSAGESGDGDAFLYKYQFTWGSGDGIRCTKVDNLVISADSIGAGKTVTNMRDIFPGYPRTADVDKTCEPGSRCTTISVRGYNQACDTVGGYGTVEREVLLQF